MSLLGNGDSRAAARIAKIVASKWMLGILQQLEGGPKRFHELQRSLAGISPKTLADRLRELDNLGIVIRQVYAEIPPRVEYSLTPKGTALLPLIQSLGEYARRWLAEPSEGIPRHH